MDDKYQVGALGDLIAASKGIKIKKTKSELKIENTENQHPEHVSKNDVSLKSKKRKSKKNPSEVSVKKLKKTDNALNISQCEETIIDTPIKKSLVIENDTPEVENSSKTFEKSIKKKKIKKPKDNSVKTDEKTKNTLMKKEKKNSSKLQDIKSSAEYIEKESRTIFVGNIPVNIKMSAIKKAFKEFGEIETTRLRSVAVKNLDKPKRASIMKGDFHPQRDTANVYVRFKTLEQAQKALALNATQFEGHTIRVDMALNSGHKQNKKKGIFIGNLPYNIQEDEIWEFFKDCGTISAVRIVRDNATGVCKGFGYVDFETRESVELAMQLQGKRVQNRELRIKRIETKTNTNNVFNKNSTPFKRTKPINKNNQSFQGETMKPKSLKKKPKPTKTDLMRKRIAKKLNS